MVDDQGETALSLAVNQKIKSYANSQVIASLKDYGAVISPSAENIFEAAKNGATCVHSELPG